MGLQAEVFWPTLIWNTTLPDDQKSLLLKVKDYIVDLSKDNPEGVKKTNYGGWQSKSYSKYPDELKPFSDAIDEAIKPCAQQIGVPELKLKNFWYNINNYGDYNKLHNHRGSVLSGVFYIDVPDENMGKINFERSDDIAYYLPPLENYNNVTSERASYEPETGKLLIFPSWTKHSVDGSRSKHSRISMSFNYGV
tara:strand:+ start:1899 stop:2480 length:582 start_codon:yes stop_codon:yes gene_type:complete